MTLPWLPMGHFAFFFVARDKGFWQKRGLDVSIDRGMGSADAAKLVGAGRYEFGYADLATMILVAGQGMDLTSVGMVNYISPLGLTSLKKSNIVKPKDLEGKRYGTSAGSGEFVLFPAFARAAGIDGDKVQKILMSPVALSKALIEGTIDVRGSFYPSMVDLMAMGVETNQILYHNAGLKMYSLGIFTTRDRVRADRDLCARFTAGALEGLAYSYLHIDETIDLHLRAIREYQGASYSREMVRLGLLVNAALGIDAVPQEKGLGWMDPEMVRQTRDLVVKYMGLKSEPPLDALYTNAFAGTVRLSAAEWQRVKDAARPYILW
ncbi:MAG: ABC transporter substrate-binding protein [Deltaproteobacteria bacterium]|nr:ABC transporter substrate-binding protein [Deltaproteobacteria bacterium]